MAWFYGFDCFWRDSQDVRLENLYKRGFWYQAGKTTDSRDRQRPPGIFQTNRRLSFGAFFYPPAFPFFGGGIGRGWFAAWPWPSDTPGRVPRAVSGGWRRFFQTLAQTVCGRLNPWGCSWFWKLQRFQVPQAVPGASAKQSGFSDLIFVFSQGYWDCA